MNAKSEELGMDEVKKKWVTFIKVNNKVVKLEEINYLKQDLIDLIKIYNERKK